MRILVNIICTFFALTLYGQGSILKKDIETITIEATRINIEKLKSPLSISKIDLNSILDARQKTSLNEVINQVPGIFSLNQYNSAQDLRISIRGFGARSAFGIRGINLIVDGVPLTTPDGQGQVDNLWVGGIKSIEIMRGTSSAIHGNASGGVLNISTFDDTKWAHSSLGFRLGSYGEFASFYDGKLSLGKNKIYAQLNHNRIDGYRKHSRSVNNNYNFKYTRSLGKDHDLSYLISYLNSPEGQDPGGVTQQTVENDRTAARDRNITYDAGESISQVNHSLQYKNKFSKYYELASTAFFSNRNFEGLLPFANGGAIDLERNYGGLMVHLNYSRVFEKWKHDIVFGVDYKYQNDLRRRFANNEGVRGEETLNQNEIFTNYASYLTVQSQFEKLLFQGGLRYDWNLISLEDNYISDNDDSGKLDLPNLSPFVSGSYNIHASQYLFTSFSYGFETPTLSELTNNPDNSGGLNDLKAQESYNYEVGYKAKFGKKAEFSATLFAINSVNELLPYELDEFPGRSFFRNTGQTSRQGAEMEWTIPLHKYLTFNGAYSYSRFRFVQYVEDGLDFEDNTLPGIPEHNGFFSIRFNNTKSSITWSNRAISSIYVDNVNDVKVDPFIVGNLSASWKYQFIILKVIPFAGINNLYNVKYNDNLRLNAFGGRYYEPAPEINFYAGVKINL